MGACPDVHKYERPEVDDGEPVAINRAFRRLRDVIVHDAEDRRREEEGDRVVAVPPLDERVLGAAKDRVALHREDRDGERIYNVQNGDGDNRRNVEPDGYIQVLLPTLGERAEEVHREDDPNQRDRNVDRPFELRVFFPLGVAHRERNRGCDDDRLPAPEVDVRQEIGEKTGFYEALRRVVDAGKHHVADEGEDDGVRVERAEAPKGEPGAGRGGVCRVPGQLEGDDDADEHADDAENHRRCDEFANNVIVVGDAIHLESLGKKHGHRDRRERRERHDDRAEEGGHPPGEREADGQDVVGKGHGEVPPHDPAKLFGGAEGDRHRGDPLVAEVEVALGGEHPVVDDGGPRDERLRRREGVVEAVTEDKRAFTASCEIAEGCRLVFWPRVSAGGVGREPEAACERGDLFRVVAGEEGDPVAFAAERTEGARDAGFLGLHEGERGKRFVVLLEDRRRAVAEERVATIIASCTQAFARRFEDGEVGPPDEADVLRAGERVAERLALRVGGASDERTENFPIFLGNTCEDFRVFEARAPFGQRPGLVKYKGGDRRGAVEKAGGADEEAALPESRLDELVGERRGDAEGARAGDDQDRGGDGEGAREVVGRQEPAAEPEDGERQDGEDPIAGKCPIKCGFSGVVPVAWERGSEEIGDATVGERFRGDELDGAPTDVEGAAGDDRPSSIRTGALATDPVEGDGEFGGGEGRVDGEEIARREEDAVADDEIRGRDRLQTRGATVAGFKDVCIKKIGTCRFPQALSVLVDDAPLEQAAEEHQRDEDGDGVEVGGRSPAVRGHVADAGAGVGEEHSKGDREVEMEDAATERSDSPLDENGRSDQDGEAGDDELKSLKKNEKRPFIEPRIDCEGEEHRVHREGDGDAEAHRDSVRITAGAEVLCGAEFHADAQNVLGEGVEIERRRDAERDGAARGIDMDRVCGGRAAAKELIDEPDARGAVHAEEASGASSPDWRRGFLRRRGRKSGSGRRPGGTRSPLCSRCSRSGCRRRGAPGAPRGPGLRSECMLQAVPASLPELRGEGFSEPRLTHRNVHAVAKCREFACGVSSRALRMRAAAKTARAPEEPEPAPGIR
ncbi:hypothetical protein OUZ56_032484 [Daphnia magna]|uniref:Uncharacterized protein n=1 Tax=Daphnia magna TaxID=35525 RepID=A0ABR0B913_9CRUS|nr:hypothetical protein OUZ56_032484 [Daphnia magna]